MNEDEIPIAFWREFVGDMEHPSACFDRQNFFIWVNTAFEKLVGLNRTELLSKTWMDITYEPDVGGDYRAVQAIIAGRINHYSMAKKFVHKRGHHVPVDLTVRRFPRTFLEDLCCFMVEAPPARATRPELDHLEEKFTAMVNSLREKQESSGVSVSYNKEGNVGGDRVGNDKNSDKAIKYMTGAMVAMVGMIAYLFYYVATVANNTTPISPTTNTGKP